MQGPRPAAHGLGLGHGPATRAGTGGGIRKSSEIVAIPLLLRRLERVGAIVTIDAMGTQTQIAQTILDGGGDYVLALKQNRPATFTEVEAVIGADSRATPA